MKIYFFFILFESLLVLNLSAQINKGNLDSVYQVAKKEFSEFEKLHGKFIQTKNINMHYLTWGDSSNPCLIWAHGSITNSYELLGIADSLANAGFYVIAIDYYGHGQTPIPDHEVSLYHIADDIKFLMDKLGINKSFIGGFSRGGYVAAAFYDCYPNCVSGLILEDGGSVSFNTYNQKLNSQELQTKAESFDSNVAYVWDTVYSSERRAYEAMFDIHEKGNQFSILALIKEENTNEWSIIYSKMMALFNLESSQEFLDLTLRPTKVPLFARSLVMMEPKIIFRNLDVPILILDPVSANDPMPFEKENKELKGEHPEMVDYIVYQDITHNIHYERPEQFTIDVISFMKTRDK